jgi:hypothetical protein
VASDDVEGGCEGSPPQVSLDDVRDNAMPALSSPHGQRLIGGVADERVPKSELPAVKRREVRALQRADRVPNHASQRLDPERLSPDRRELRDPFMGAKLIQALPNDSLKSFGNICDRVAPPLTFARTRSVQFLQVKRDPIGSSYDFVNEIRHQPWIEIGQRPPGFIRIERPQIQKIDVSRIKLLGALRASRDQNEEAAWGALQDHF